MTSRREKAFDSVDAYIAAQSREQRDSLAQVRAAIRKALPDAVEAISYHMPTYKIDGAVVLHFAAWKAHYSIYAASAGVVAALKNELERYAIEKGTIRFPFDEPVPAALIQRIAKLKAAERRAKA